MSYQDAFMFEVDLPAVATPKRPRDTGRPRWSRYRAKNPVKCDDCMLVLALAKGEGPAALYAHHRRVLNGTDLLLCHAHARVRRDEDGLDPLKER